MAGSWREILATEVAAKAEETRRRGGGSAAVQRMSRMQFSPAAHEHLVEAASRRGISLSGYIRRATMARVALDLGMDPIELFELDVAIAPSGKGGYGAIRDLDGARWGRWEVREA